MSNSTNLTFPLPANDYGGFCKGAYYLQAGLNGDGVELRSNSIATTGESWYWGCRNTKCVFESTACKKGKEYFFDDTVCDFERNGKLLMRYRWSFLAKSHVAIKKSKNKVYDYRCIFCVLQGVSAPVITMKRPFLEHVAEHGAHQLDDWMLWKTLCITNRVATDDESFDLKFLPPTQEGEEREVSADPKRESATTEVERSFHGLGLCGDTMLGGKPWQNS